MLDYFTSGTFFDLLGYTVPLKTPNLPDTRFPGIVLSLGQVAKRNCFPQILRTCPLSIEGKTI